LLADANENLVVEAGITSGAEAGRVQKTGQVERKGKGGKSEK
jgi:hypothetical protein